MCEPTTILTGISLAASAAGGAVQYNASRKQAKALDIQKAGEQRRQSSVMRDQMRLQERQREDALKARKQFQDKTLPAFTREGMDADTAGAQTSLSAALQSAGERATSVPGGNTADATQATGAVSVSNDGAPRAAGDNAAHRVALRSRIAQANDVNRQAASAQGAMLALNRAQMKGSERLATAANAIDLENAKLTALNRPRMALGGVADASRSMYGVLADKAADTGAGTALAGQALGALGNLGYSYASRGSWATPTTPDPQAIPIT